MRKLENQYDVCHFYHGYKKERDWEILNYSYTSENFQDALEDAKTFKSFQTKNNPQKIRDFFNFIEEKNILSFDEIVVLFKFVDGGIYDPSVQEILKKLFVALEEKRHELAKIIT